MKAKIIVFVQAALVCGAVLPSSGAPASGNGLTDCEAKVYWTSPGSSPGDGEIRRSSLDGTNVETLVTEGIWAPWPLEIDLAAGKMYWGDVNQGRIQRANLDGTSVETVVAFVFPFIDNPAGLALDPAGGMLYWTDFARDKISRTNLTTGTTETLISTGLRIPLGIDLDLDSGRMYWVDAQNGTIQRANLNGSGVFGLMAGLSNPRDIALQGGKMYWVELSGEVFRANLDGTAAEMIVPRGELAVGVSQYLALDLVNGKVYWGTGLGVSRANLDGSDIERNFISVGFPWNVHGVAIVPPEIAPGDLDGGGAVNLDDFVLFHGCITGPDVPFEPGCCGADFDTDGDSDLADIAKFQLAITGGP